jgi:hypothetical protein
MGPAGGGHERIGVSAAPGGRLVTTLLPVDAPRAFRLVEDPKSFEYLVAGARRIRRFDARWPEPGTAIHHTVGVPPLVLRDRTEVLALEKDRRLLLAAHLRPLGTLEVEFTFETTGTGCLLTVREVPRRGPISWPGVRGMAIMAVWLRNLEICRRYRRLVRIRQAATGQVSDG